MAIEIYLGDVLVNIKTWIVNNLHPSGHSDTRFTLTANSGNTEDVRQMMINASVDKNIDWDMPTIQN